eukprot:CAMPEP_0170510646 /NCGR_PEP_ID=MMETSP0208-20121228/65879_1 /TAXON_ID=197538 /ORGANISM="Strombidium inclinatum, Strain S3" /LENGTH=55 /DNA_ID=CAMNT_0010794129 /DNA_START=1979 /DNA_END=2146 /DNA_ORIENTATION=+
MTRQLLVKVEEVSVLALVHLQGAENELHVLLKPILVEVLLDGPVELLQVSDLVEL